jgi:ATP-binding cassette subfamily F protein uup
LLQEMIGEYPGTVLVVSHDRDFLDRVATSTLVAEGAGAWVEYAGGYSDMLVQRGTAPVASTKVKTASRTTALAPTAQGAKAPGLTFKQQHELKTLAAEIEKLKQQLPKLEAAVAVQDLYTKDPKRFAAATAALAVAQAALSKAEDRWLELELIK